MTSKDDEISDIVKWIEQNSRPRGTRSGQFSSRDNALKIIFFTGLAGASIIFGFSRTMNRFRASEAPATDAEKLYEAGSALARKALLRATLYSVGVFSVASCAAYKLVGESMIEDFKEKNYSEPQDHSDKE